MFEFLKKKSLDKPIDFDSPENFFTKPHYSLTKTDDINFFEYDVFEDKNFNRDQVLTILSLIVGMTFMVSLVLPSGLPAQGEFNFIGIDLATVFAISHLTSLISGCLLVPLTIRKIWGKKRKPLDYCLSMFSHKLWLPAWLFFIGSMSVNGIINHTMHDRIKTPVVWHQLDINHLDSPNAYLRHLYYQEKNALLHSNSVNINSHTNTQLNAESLDIVSVIKNGNDWQATLNVNGQKTTAHVGDTVLGRYKINNISMEKNGPVVEIENFSE